MIKSLYPQFQRWSATGSVYIISDTHFDDFDCKLMDPDWDYFKPWILSCLMYAVTVGLLIVRFVL